jgi:hypothetical protein
MNDETTRPLPDDGDEHTRALIDDERTDPTVPDDRPPEPVTGGQPPEPWQPPLEEEDGGRHPLGVAHLVAGLVFLGIAVSWLLRETGVVDSEATGWFLPMTLVVAGSIGLLAWFSSARGKSR